MPTSRPAGIGGAVSLLPLRASACVSRGPDAGRPDVSARYRLFDFPPERGWAPVRVEEFRGPRLPECLLLSEALERNAMGHLSRKARKRPRAAR
jgi:hypothetical protein